MIDYSNPVMCLFIAEETGKLLLREFNCKGCGACCSQSEIVVLDEELPIISKGLGLSEKVFRHKYLRKLKKGWSIRKSNPCVFLDRMTNRCSIYDNRPINCRIYPYFSQWFVYDIAFLLNGRQITPKPVLPPSCVAVEDFWEKVRDALKRVETLYRNGELTIPECHKKYL